MIGFLALQAEKKKPPQLPLKELTNPNSPSYVPYPYPKTDFEIIEDFRYAVKLHFGLKEGKRTSIIIKGYPDYSKLMLNLFGDTPSLEITEIIKVIDLVETSPSDYYFLLQIVNKEGEVLAMGSLEECGLMAGVTFYSEKIKFKPFKTEQQVKEMLYKALSHTNIKINEMERIALHSTICSPYAPLFKIKTSKGTFFVDYYDNVYSIESEIPWSKKNGYPDPEHKRILILDSLNEKALFLKKVNKE
jgi:hypothetical protein